MKNIIPLSFQFVLCGLVFLLSACSPKPSLTGINELDNSILLDREDALFENGTFSWNLEMENKGRFAIQLLGDGELAESVSSVSIEIDGQSIAEELEQSFVIQKDGKKKVVSNLKQSVVIKNIGRYPITVTTDALFEQVRVVPHFSNPIGTGKYHSEWKQMHESIEKQAAVEWFKEAKFGMFIHWGLYSQAAGSWKGTRIEKSPYPGPSVAEWLMFKFRISRNEYAELAKTFNPDKSFARNIAKLAKDSGMKYMVITSKHHDGFALFDSASSDFDMVDATPYKADVIKELYDACQEEGIEFGVYYSHGNDWNDGTDGNYAVMKERNDRLGYFTHPMGKNLWDPSQNTHAEYLDKKAYPQIEELISLLPELRLIWFDGDGFVTEEQAFKFYKLVYDLNPSILVNRRVGYQFGDYLDAGDNKIPDADEALSKHWETCGTTNHSWGFKAYDDDWKSTREMLYWFVDIASKGGNYLLNIGPDGNGDVPVESARTLRGMGKWLSVNGEAIYGTNRWTVINEGDVNNIIGKGTGHRPPKGFENQFTSEQFWFTAKGKSVYAISLVESKDVLRIHSLNTSAGVIQSVRILGNEDLVDWKQSENGLEIDLTGVETSKDGFVVEAVF